jgi:hypothetical protein
MVNVVAANVTRSRCDMGVLRGSGENKRGELARSTAAAVKSPSAGAAGDERSFAWSAMECKGGDEGDARSWGSEGGAPYPASCACRLR